MGFQNKKIIIKVKICTLMGQSVFSLGSKHLYFFTERSFLFSETG